MNDRKSTSKKFKIAATSLVIGIPVLAAVFYTLATYRTFPDSNQGQTFKALDGVVLNEVPKRTPN